MQYRTVKGVVVTVSTATLLLAMLVLMWMDVPLFKFALIALLGGVLGMVTLRVFVWILLPMPPRRR